MAADDGSAGLLPRQSDGANSPRSKNGMHPRREYDLLGSEATEGGPDNTGNTGSKDGHGATEDQEGMGTEEEGGETLQRILPA